MISSGTSVMHLARFVNGYPFKPEDLGTEGLPVIRIRHLLDESVEPESAQPPHRGVLIDDGDLIFSWSATLAVRRWKRGPALLNQHLFRVDVAPRVDKGWFTYVLLEGIERLRPLMHGSAMTHITQDMLRSLTVSVPPPDRQAVIAAYLDTETARIDALIAKKRRMIELIGFRWWESFIHRVLANQPDAVQLRRAFAFITDGPFGSAFSSANYSEDGAAVVRLGNIGFAEYRADDQAFIPLGLYQSFLRHQVRAGDLLIAGLGDANNHAGRACVAPDLGPAIVKGKCFCARVRRDIAVPEYLALLLSSRLGADAIGLSARGSTRTMINLDVVKAAMLPLPPVESQVEIVETTDAERMHLRTLSSKLAAQIDLLSEHRQALITAAVTGKLKVPGVAA